MKLTSLKFTAAALMTILIFTSVLIFGYLSYRNVHNTFNEKYENESEIVLNDTAHSFEEYFASSMKALNTIADDRRLYDLTDNGTISSDAIQSILPDGSTIQIGYIDGDYVNMKEENIPESYDPREQDWYQKAVADSGVVTWTDPYFNYMTQDIIITASRAFYDQSGEILGVVAVNFDETEISKKISHSKIGMQGYVMLLSENGTVLANKENFMIGRQIFDDAILSEKSGNFERFYINELPYKAKYTKLQTNGMLIFVAASINEINENSVQSFIPVIISVVLCLFVFIMIVYLFALKFIKPIESFLSIMTKAENGDYNVVAKMDHYYEFKRLSESFNAMIGAIKKRDEELNSSYRELAENEKQLIIQYTELKKSQIKLMENEKKIHHLAYFDYLTGLPNRSSLIEKLSEELMKEEGKSGGAILFLDIDNFKYINDTMGHSTGDVILLETARRLNMIDQKGLYISRFGGDEFILIAKDYNDYDLAIELCQKICIAFEEMIIIEKRKFEISTSIGVSFYPQHGKTTDELLKKADLAMYKAKDKGKNCFQIFDESLQTELFNKSNIETGLRNALKRNEFTLVYQPLFDIRNKKIRRVEALLRWDSPELGNVPTPTFIKAAEKTGQIVKIEKWVLTQVCLFSKQLNENVKEKISISVNISPIHIMHRDFVPNIINTINEIGIDPQMISLEITESAFIESFELCKEKLEILKNFGLEIYLDDFGTGYSALNCLQKLPIDYIKIDKTFIDPILQSRKDEKLAAIIIDLVHNMGVSAIAEGVEEKEQFHILSHYKCDIIQGYLISKPIPPDEVIQKLNGEEYNE